MYIFGPLALLLFRQKQVTLLIQKIGANQRKGQKPLIPHLHNLNISLDNLITFLSQSLNYDNQQGVEIDNKWLRKKVNEYNNKVPASDNSYLFNFLDTSIEKIRFKES